MKKRVIIILGVIIAIIIAFHFSESRAKASNPEFTKTYNNFHHSEKSNLQHKKFQNRHILAVLKNTIKNEVKRLKNKSKN